MEDFTVTNHGSIFLIRPNNDNAETWLREYVQAEQHQFFGKAIAVEHRFINDIVEGARADGLEVA